MKSCSLVLRFRQDSENHACRRGVHDAKQKNYTLPLILFVIENKINPMDFEKYLSFDFNKYILKSEEYIEKYKQK